MFKRARPSRRGDRRRCPRHGHFSGTKCPSCGKGGKARYTIIWWVNGQRYRELSDATSIEEAESVLDLKEQDYWRRQRTGSGALEAAGGPLPEVFALFTRSKGDKSSDYLKQITTVQRVFCAGIGKKDITDISVEDLEDFKFEGLAKKSSSTVRSYMTVLRTFFKWAYKRGYVRVNVAELVDLPGATTRRNQSLMPAEVPVFLACCDAVFRPIAATAIFAGLRRAEVCNLMWPQVDLTRRFLWVESNDGVNGEAWSPKTAASEGVVPIHPILATALAEVPRVTINDGTPSAWVFPMLNGGARRGQRRAGDTTWFLRKTKEAAAAAGIDRPITFHGLRRSLGTLLRYAGQDVVTVQRALRHASPVVSEKHYIGQDAALLQRAIDSIELPGAAPLLE